MARQLKNGKWMPVIHNEKGQLIVLVEHDINHSIQCDTQTEAEEWEQKYITQ